MAERRGSTIHNGNGREAVSERVGHHNMLHKDCGKSMTDLEGDGEVSEVLFEWGNKTGPGSDARRDDHHIHYSLTDGIRLKQQLILHTQQPISTR